MLYIRKNPCALVYLPGKHLRHKTMKKDLQFHFKTTLTLVYFIITSIFQWAYAEGLPLSALKNGDLIFVGAEKENLSGAINRVTQTRSHLAFDHVGIIERIQDSIFILHASPGKGCARESLPAYLKKAQHTQTKFEIFRLHENFQYSITAALQTAKPLLGQAYNWSYIANDTSLYCSDFIERIFRKDAIFDLEPMTFINPATNKIDSYWLNFYTKLGLEVPEGQLGCNPNGLAASDKLYFV